MEIHMVKNRQKGITNAYRKDKKDVDTRILFSCSSLWTSLAYSFPNVLEEFDFCTRPYSNASVDRAGTPNPSSK